MRKRKKQPCEMKKNKIRSNARHGHPHNTNIYQPKVNNTFPQATKNMGAKRENKNDMCGNNK